jgi:hypothetical protein
MQINRKDLIDVLSKIKPALGEGLIEQSEDFIFNKTSVYTYNNEITISCNFESNIIGSVKAKIM